MYERKSEGWLKHIDFSLLDLLCLQAAFLLAYTGSGHAGNPYISFLYRNMAIVIEIIDVIVIFAFETMKGVLKRGRRRELVITVEHALIVGAVCILYLFLLQYSTSYSRLAFVFMIVFYILITYIVREAWKHFLRKKMAKGGDRSLLIVTTSDVAKTVVHTVITRNYAQYTIAGIAIIDQPITGETIEGIPVVADMGSAPTYVCQEWIDEVFVIPSEGSSYPHDLVDTFVEMGVTVHQNLAKITDMPGKKQSVGRVSDYTVLTTSINAANGRQIFLKRLMDIIGGLVGCLITAILFIFVAPAIFLSSPGPIFFTQERVGKNGRKFKMYKFRSMYRDAEERKAELMEENKLSDGKMFKLDFDPRVIGNKILPDGTKKTGIGNFIRSTSIDEFPQFFNVLKGDMSIVGTRPPLSGEVSLYELHHRSRLAIKPGITGLWQVSGRSDITDFEEVVRLDRQYISEWSIWMDIKIICKTVVMIVKRDGAV